MAGHLGDADAPDRAHNPTVGHVIRRAGVHHRVDGIDRRRRHRLLVECAGETAQTPSPARLQEAVMWSRLICIY